MKYIIANWKANGTVNQTNEWFNLFVSKLKTLSKIRELLNTDRVMVIIAPQFPFVARAKEKISGLKNLFIAAQDVSEFEQGSHTGDVTAMALQDLVSYAIVGHSERRAHYRETNGQIKKKLDLLQKYNIKSLLCVRDKDDFVDDAFGVVYEPTGAIGTGNNANPQEVLLIKKALPLRPETPFLYGGSVNKDNVLQYLSLSEVDGVLVGAHSLDPEEFVSIINKV